MAGKARKRLKRDAERWGCARWFWDDVGVSRSAEHVKQRGTEAHDKTASHIAWVVQDALHTKPGRVLSREEIAAMVAAGSLPKHKGE